MTSISKSGKVPDGDQWYEIRVFGTYWYVPDCTEYILVRNAENGTSMYWYVLSMYRNYDMYDCHEVWRCFSF
jgi:hypothetical protein